MAFQQGAAPVDDRGGFEPADETWILEAARQRGGFLMDTEVAALGRSPRYRLTPLLVRAGACRVICAAQDVAHVERCLVAGGDYVRDVSMPAREGGR